MVYRCCFQFPVFVAILVILFAIATALEAGVLPRVGTSFVATSNKDALTAKKVYLKNIPLESIIRSNYAFKEAFKPTDSRHGPEPIIMRISGENGTKALPARWGLVSAIVDAYNNHHELLLRPDDIWQAILTQFSFYVNKYAEQLRDKFVDFKGKKTLVVELEGSIYSADYETFARYMVQENIAKNVKNLSTLDWLLPHFSTTTHTDKLAASVTLMSTLQAYFLFATRLACGIPAVTLLGTVEDWRQLRMKADHLLEYDMSDHMTSWHKLLVPVLDEFVKSSAGNSSLDFWDQICSTEMAGSGPRYLSGWVTVFAAFSHRGEWQAKLQKDTWPVVDFGKLPVGVVSVPVLIDDNGMQYDSQMFAGQFAYETVDAQGVTLQPRTDWCIAYTGEQKADPQDYVHGEVREL